MVDDGRQVMQQAAAARPVCPACLDLDYSLYDAPLREPFFYQGQELRYHITSFWELEKRATQGCRICAVLHRGIQAVWDVKRVGLTGHAMREWEQYRSRATMGPPDRKDSKMDDVAWQREASKRSSEEDENDRFYRPCIELRPGRSLLVSNALYKRVVQAEGHWGRKLGQNPLEFEHFLRRAPLEFYSQPGPATTIHPAFGRKEHIPAALTPEHYQRKLNQWLRACSTHHRICSDTSSPANPPKRLIYIHPDGDDRHLRLIETARFPGFAGGGAAYTTLSHCWGNESDALALKKTVRANLDAHLEHLQVETLPRLFRDAITVTRMVGCRFLWIDSLCIVQDSADDWRHHAYRMADIYSHSHLNIAATALANSAGSLFFSRTHVYEPGAFNRERVQTVSMEAREVSGAGGGKEGEAGGGVWVRPFPQITHGNFLLRSPEDPANPLLQRGWVFQERLLSRRTLHCTASELVWECRACTWCECGDLGDCNDDEEQEDETQAVQQLPTKTQFQNMFEPDSTPQSLLYDWMSIVTRYNHLQFSHPRDLPFAFAGVAQKVGDRIRDSGGSYVAGLWTADLPRNLLWVGNKKRIGHDEGSRVYPVDWEKADGGPPSWSWLWYASWPGARSAHYYGYLERVEVDADAVVDLERLVCNTEDGNPFGSVVEGVLRMRGRVIRGKLRTGEPKSVPKGFSYSHVREDAYVTFEKFGRTPGFPIGTDCYLFVRDSEGHEIEQEVTCLLVGHERERVGAEWSKKELRFFVLILARAGQRRSYRRIGIARWPKSSQVFKDEAVAEVEIE
ncbi:hypothetical protein DIS24_g4224 [Lasiodiplodia hormozganensis]|uniref:Heterokaryon incompatibility domain-containing protein n=1 Tax=Lasiodiplodia hormozganensis TaxID=869390 RepID=A0AA39YUU5_9PEZI|nr:hypothetical protein DIS24_g4224 [Lasiodiplodia hormozganensis]